MGGQARRTVRGQGAEGLHQHRAGLAGRLADDGGSTAEAREDTPDRGAEGHLHGDGQRRAVAAHMAGSAMAYPRQVP